jgi:phytoene dehydrogenase-like protein
MRIPSVSKPPSTPDALVVGGGFSGLLTAALLLKNGKSVHLAEKLPKLGGRLSPERRDGFSLGAGFAFGDCSWWKAIGDRLNLSVNLTPVNDGGSLVHGSRGWVSPEEIPDWENYLSRPCTEFPALGHFGLVETLLNHCAESGKFTYSLETPVTALVGENGKIISANLGADLSVTPAEVHWAADYKNLQEVLRGVGVPEPGPERVSWMKKFQKSSPQPGVVLEFAHKTKFAEFTESLLVPFPAGDKEERRYLVGSFVSNRDPSLAPAGKSLSAWMFPLSELEWGDNHESMKKIRSARRMLDKTFAGFDQSVEFERVLVLDSTVHPLNKKKGDLSALMHNLHLSADWAMPHGATLEGITQGLLG